MLNLCEYDDCILCPRNCHVNRNKNEKGFCKQGASLYIAWAGLHFGEEPPITASGGSGTIFVAGCNLACAFCQNWQISQECMGRAITPDEFSLICLKLQEKGASNINIVTGSHNTLPIIEGLRIAKIKGLHLPILWNTSSYEKQSEIVRLSSQIDIWLPDIKTFDSSLAFSCFRASDYPKIARDAILKMVEYSPLVYAGQTTSDFENTLSGEFSKLEDISETSKDKERLISGVIVRHLALPNRLKDTEEILKWFTSNLNGRALLSLMTQYTPIGRTKINEINFDRYIEAEEDEALRELLSKYDIEDGFYQELVQDSTWLPDFRRVQPFSSSLATPIWHWKCGFV